MAGAGFGTPFQPDTRCSADQVRTFTFHLHVTCLSGCVLKLDRLGRAGGRGPRAAQDPRRAPQSNPLPGTGYAFFGEQRFNRGQPVLVVVTAIPVRATGFGDFGRTAPRPFRSR